MLYPQEDMILSWSHYICHLCHGTQHAFKDGKRAKTQIWDTAGQERFRSQWAGTWGTDKMHQFTYIKMIQYAFIWPRKWCSQWFSINSLWNLWTLRCHRCHRHFFRNLTASCRCAGPLQRATTVEPTASSWPSMSQQLGAHDSGRLLLS